MDYSHLYPIYFMYPYGKEPIESVTFKWIKEIFHFTTPGYALWCLSEVNWEQVKQCCREKKAFLLLLIYCENAIQFY